MRSQRGHCLLTWERIFSAQNRGNELIEAVLTLALGPSARESVSKFSRPLNKNNSGKDDNNNNNDNIYHYLSTYSVPD